MWQYARAHPSCWSLFLRLFFLRVCATPPVEELLAEKLVEMRTLLWKSLSMRRRGEESREKLPLWLSLAISDLPENTIGK